MRAADRASPWWYGAGLLAMALVCDGVSPVRPAANANRWALQRHATLCNLQGDNRMNQQAKLSNILSVSFFLFLVVQVTFTILIWRDVQVLKRQSEITLSGPLIGNSPLFTGKDHVPSFFFTDTSGKEISIDEWKGYSALIIFSSHECSACKNMYASLANFLTRNPELYVVLLTVGTPDANAQFIEDYSLSNFANFTVGGITENTWTSLGVIGTPTLVLTKGDNKIAGVWFGYSDALWQEVENKK
jgi:peroxiredoxin